MPPISVHKCHLLRYEPSDHIKHDSSTLHQEDFFFVGGGGGIEMVSAVQWDEYVALDLHL